LITKRIIGWEEYTCLGATMKVISPSEAVSVVRCAIEAEPSNRVVGIAGPGDPLANHQTFETLALIKKHFPRLKTCLSTNGLLLPDKVDLLHELSLDFLTVTINALDVGSANTVLIPGINEHEVEKIARWASKYAYIMNVMPLIPLGEFRGGRRPTCAQMDRARLAVKKHMRLLTCCKQCRADAVGIPGKSAPTVQKSQHNILHNFFCRH